MVQTISSFFYHIYILFIYHKIYVPLIQPFTAKDPIRRLEACREYCTLGFTNPLNLTEDNPLKDESIFFNPPFHLNLNIDLSAL